MGLDSFMGKLGDALDLISIAMGGASSSRRLIIFSSGDEKFTIPVTPAGYDVTSAQNNKVVDIIEFGEAQVFGNPTLKRLSLSGFFPSLKHEYPFISGDSKTPTECVELMTKWKEAKKPIRLIITDSPVNLMVAIKSFKYKERDGTRDIYFSVDLIEYKELNTPMANNDKQTDSLTGLKQRADTTIQPDSVTIMDKTKDVLDASKKAYGDYVHWRNIVQSNDLKDLAINNLGKLKLGEKIKVKRN